MFKLIISAFIIRIIIIIIIGVLGGRGDVKANQGSGRRCAQLHAGYGLQGSEAGRVGTDCAILDYCDIRRQSCMSSEVRSLEPNIPAVSGRSSTAIGKVRVKGVDGTRPGVRVDYYWNKANNRLPYGWWWEGRRETGVIPRALRDCERRCGNERLLARSPSSSADGESLELELLWARAAL